MFNLLVGLPEGGVLSEDRLLPGMTQEEKSSLGVVGDGFEALLRLPTLALPEVGPDDASGFARVGSLQRVKRRGRRDFEVRFQPNERIEPIPAVDIWEHRHWFGVTGEWGLHRTYLAVHDVDLYLALLELKSSEEVVRPSRRYLNFPHGPVESDLVVVMMPFEDRLKPVWEKLQRVMTDENLRCERADSIFNQDSIMDDVVSLLWRARVVISDFTGMNANVFYETGIAHTLGRRCIPITQDNGAIPFDLRHLRAVKYVQSDLGMTSLGLAVVDRVRTILKDS